MIDKGHRRRLPWRGSGRSAALVVAAACLAAPAAADAVLVLEDGQELTGTEVIRKGDDYTLRLATGGVLSLPAALVREVRIIELGDDPDDPEPGFVIARGETVAGTPSRLPRRQDQLDAFGRDPSRFPRDVVPTRWYPESDWDPDVSLNDFSPSRWYRSQIDPSWQPTDGFGGVGGFRSILSSTDRSRFARDLVETDWRPGDGFSRRNAGFARFRGDLTFEVTTDTDE